MYWTERGWDHPRIEKSTMAGTERKLLVDAYFFFGVHISLNGLVIDFNSDLLYWVDSNNRAVEQSDLDGNNRRDLNLYSSLTWRSYGLTLYEDMLYASDVSSKTIERINITTEERYRNMGYLTQQLPWRIALNDSSREPQGIIHSNNDKNCINSNNEEKAENMSEM